MNSLEMASPYCREKLDLVVPESMSMANSCLRGNGCMEEAGTVRSPREVIEVCKFCHSMSNKSN
jgi:hypothetical protein